MTPQPLPPLVPSSGRWEGDRHLYPLRVHWENTDAGGIVYHSQYLNFAERARTEMLRLLGLSQQALLAGAGLGFAVARLEIDYRKPAVLDDLLIVDSRIAHVGAAVLDITQTIRRMPPDDRATAEPASAPAAAAAPTAAAAAAAATDLADLRVRVACLAMAQGQPVRLPRWLRDHLTPPGAPA